MRLERVEIVRLALGMRRDVGTAAGAHTHRPVILVRVLAGGVEGWGECAALPGGTSVDPSIESMWPFLSGTGMTPLLSAAQARGGALPPAEVVARLYGSSPAARQAASALEMAVLDAELRAEGNPLWARLGVDPAAAEAGVPVGDLVGIPPGLDIDVLIDEVSARVGHAPRVRLKIAPGWDVEPVKAVRRAFPTLALQVDANGAYRLSSDGADDLGRLVALDPYGLVCIEQPLPPGDLVALAEAARRLATPVCLDESIGSPRQLVDALRYGACEVACLKPGRLGGLLAARRCLTLCRDAGVDAFIGGFFETGLGRAANAALAALPGSTLPGDLSDPADYLEVDPFCGPEPRDGVVALHPGPGIAPLPSADVLERVTDEEVAFAAD